VRIILKRSGGFAGIQTAASLDLEKLPEKKAAEARLLIEKSKFFDLPKTVRAKRPEPDRFQFDVTIEDGDRSHTVSIAEEAASKDLKLLLSWLRKNLTS
jgi:hypothetical protein